MNYAERTDESRAAVVAGRANGQPVAEYCRSAGISPASYYKWRLELSPHTPLPMPQKGNSHAVADRDRAEPMSSAALQAVVEADLLPLIQVVSVIECWKSNAATLEGYIGATATATAAVLREFIADLEKALDPDE